MKDQLKLLEKRASDSAIILKNEYYSYKGGYRIEDSIIKATESQLDQHERAWKLFAGALRNTITGGSNWDNLQLVTDKHEIRWDDPEFGDYYFHKITADLINETGSSYRKTNYSFSERYGHFVNDLYKPPIDSEAYKKAREAFLEAMKAELDHKDIEDSIAQEWQHFDDRQRSGTDPADWITVDEWYNGRASRILQASKQLLSASWGKYYHWIQKAFGGGETVVNIMRKYQEIRKIKVKVPRVNTNRTARKTEIFPYQISHDYPTWLSRARQRDKPNTIFSIRHNSHTYDYSRTRIGAGIGIGFGFFGVIAGGTRDTTRLSTTSQEFRLDFEADIKTFEILPGDWYDTSALNLFKNGPFAPNSAIENKYKRGELFGPKGFFSFSPIRAIVAYKPKVTVKLSRHEYRYFKQVTRGAAGFFVGPFAIGVGGYYDERKHVHWDDRNLTLKIYDGPETPHLIAFDSQKLY